MLQINLHHCKEASSVLRCSLDSGQTGIVLIQEPYFFRGGVRELGNAGLLHYVTGNKPARACVFARKDVNSLLLKQFSNNGLGKTLICCSAYLPYDESVPTPELIRLVNYCKGKNLDLLIGCDANSHHIVWGSSDINTRGRSLLEFILAAELSILNRGNRPTFINQVREEVIDITICSAELEQEISGWKVLQEDFMSDHQTISFQLNADKVEPIPFRNPKKTNWTSYKKKLDWRIGT